MSNKAFRVYFPYKKNYYTKQVQLKIVQIQELYRFTTTEIC